MKARVLAKTAKTPVSAGAPVASMIRKLDNFHSSGGCKPKNYEEQRTELYNPQEKEWKTNWHAKYNWMSKEEYRGRAEEKRAGSQIMPSRASDRLQPQARNLVHQQ